MSEPGPTASVDAILQSGPVYVGVMMSFYLFGAYMVQLYDYASNAKSDKVTTKIFVTFVTAIELVGIGLIADAGWFKHITSQSQIAPMVPFSFAGSTVFGSLAGVCMQAFFAWRIFSFRKNIVDTIAAGLVIALSLVQFSAALAAGIMFAMLNNNQDNTADFGSTIGTHLSASVAADVIITAAMVSLLNRYNVLNTASKDRSFLGNLVANTVESGAFTALFAILNLAFFLARPFDSIHNVFHWVLGRIYANVILAVLNNRQRLQELANSKLVAEQSSGDERGLTPVTEVERTSISKEAA